MAALAEERRGYWLWLGPLVDEEVMLKRHAVSTGAIRWQAGLLEGLAAEGQVVRALSYVPEPVWPRGRQWVSGTECSRPGIDVTGISYLNVPVLKEMTLRMGHLTALRRLVRTRGVPEVALSYNAPGPYLAAGRWLLRRALVPWIPVILDSPRTAPEVPVHERRLRAASGRVFLSWGSYASWTGRTPSLHLDGGVQSLPAPQPRPASRAILYSGALSKYGGIDFLVRAFQLVRAPDVELWICGKGTEIDRGSLSTADPRIRVLGTVPEAKLKELSAMAAVFANPRPPELYATQHTFPSKVLEYLSYGKPVVSTWSQVFSDSYRRVLLIPGDESPAAFALCLQQALDMPTEKREALRRTICDFLDDKLWRVQARRLIDWVRTEVLP